MAKDERRMTFIVVPSGSGELESRSFEISYRRLKAAALVIALAVLLWTAMAATYWYVAAQAARVPGLDRQIAVLESERERVVQLAETLSRIEGQYEQVRSMLGAERPADPAGLWLPPVGSGAPPEERRDTVQASLPTSWPLVERGFVTRGHLADLPGEHTGLDIAVAEGSYVRAAGAGVVLDSGEDTVYGRFVRIGHREGYESMYAHAAEIFVERDDLVERHQVIALSGSTGRSTAPHLHFEIRRNGESVDPTAYVEPDR
jgi:murein DD-endopeptidase MepM/ murein hydrolase activator NlpD